MSWQIVEVCPRCAGIGHDLDGEVCPRCFGVGEVFVIPPNETPA